MGPVFESVDLIGRTGDELWERLQYASSWLERFDVCDRVLLRHLSEGGVARELARCWRAIVASGGRLPVEQLAADTGYSRQHLTKLFRREFGLGPKLASRIVRFERVQRALLGAHPSATLAEVAAGCGYADQAHLSREFTALTGCPPSAWLAEDFQSFKTPLTSRGDPGCTTSSATVLRPGGSGMDSLPQHGASLRAGESTVDSTPKVRCGRSPRPS